MSTAKKPEKKDVFYAKVAFFLSLGFWIPLFNLAMSLLSIYYATKAMQLIRKNPGKFGGFYYALAALILSLTSLIMSALGLAVYYNRKRFCI